MKPAKLESSNYAVGMIQEMPGYGAISVPAWHLGLDEFGGFLLHWGWVLKVRPPFLSNEDLELMNKYHNKNKEIQQIEEEEEGQHPLHQLLQALIGKKQ